MATIHLEEKSIHRIFIVTLILKGINSTLEILGGVLFLFTGGIASLITVLVQQELIEDPTDFVATTIQHALPYFSTHGQIYASVYLLSHGIIKIILVISLLRNKLWAYPATVITLGLFIVYQLYRLSYGFSIFLLALTLLDVALIFLTWHEYKIVRLHPRFAKEK